LSENPVIASVLGGMEANPLATMFPNLEEEAREGSTPGAFEDFPAPAMRFHFNHCHRTSFFQAQETG
jgi:hypothetical protein